MKYNVLQLIDSFESGGSERQALQLTRLLVKSNRFNVHLSSLNPTGSLRSDVESLNIPEITSYPLNSFHGIQTLRQLTRFVQFLRAKKIAILHTHDFYTNVFGMIAGSVARVPVRIASRRETYGMRTKSQERVQRLAYSLANAVVANSGAVQQFLIQQGVADEKIWVIHNGIDHERLMPSLLPRGEILSLLGLPPDEVFRTRQFVTIVANMRHDVKDYPTFLRSARRVLERMTGVAFLLAGEGPLRESLRSYAEELKIRDAVFFLGRCDRVADLLSISEVCALSSKAEGFSNSIIEYMAAGKPVVVTNVGGAAEAVSEGITGYLVPPGDDELMAERIIRLLRDPVQRQAMGEIARKSVKENFSLPAQIERTENLYELLLRKRESRLRHEYPNFRESA